MMTVYLVISLPKIPYIHRLYMDLANPRYTPYTRMVVANPDDVVRVKSVWVGRV